MSAVVLYRIDTSKHMHRYYRIDVQRDLFGQWAEQAGDGPVVICDTDPAGQHRGLVQPAPARGP